MTKSLKKNTVLNIIKTCCSILFPLITFPYISRVLLPENIGKINFAQSFVNYFILIAGLGISTYAIRECASVKDHKDKLSNVASQLLSINLITTIISYLLLIITIAFARKFDNYRELIIIESSLIIFTTLGADWLNSAMEDFTYITLRSIFFQIISLVSIFIFVKTQNDYYKYAIIGVFSNIGPNILNMFYRKKYCNVKFTLKIEWKKHISPIMLLFVMALSQTIFNNIDVTMLGFFKGDYQVGLYSVAYKIVRIISQVVQSLSYVIIPRLSYYFIKNDYINANKLLRKVLSFNICLGLPCVVGVIMMAKDIAYIIGGNEFIAAASIMRILILTFMFSLVGGSFLGNAILIPMKKEKYYMIVCLITTVINIILNALLIPIFGANGGAISTAANGLIILILLAIKIDKNIYIEKLKNVFVAPVCGCLLITLICYMFSNISDLGIRVILTILVSCFAYATVLILMKYELMIDIIKGLKNKLRRNKDD